MFASVKNMTRCKKDSIQKICGCWGVTCFNDLCLLDIKDNFCFEITIPDSESTWYRGFLIFHCSECNKLGTELNEN
jgi:hypothetical protein